MDDNEFNKLRKAALSSNPIALGVWASNFEKSVRDEFRERYNEELLESIENYALATAYTLRYTLSLGKKRLPEIMERIWNNVDSFRTGHLSPEDCAYELEEYGIYIKSHSKKRRKNKND